jgi:hypothetical protein
MLQKEDRVNNRDADPDPHMDRIIFGKPDPDPHHNEKPDPHQKQKLEAVDYGGLTDRHGGSTWSREGLQWSRIDSPRGL